MSAIGSVVRPPKTAGPAAQSRRILLTLDTVSAESWPLAVGLHWAMATLRCQWAALHVAVPGGGAPTLVVATPAPSDGTQGGALFDFLSNEVQASVGTLATRTIGMGRAIMLGAGRGLSSQIRLPCSALCLPLHDHTHSAIVGTLSLLCLDEARQWSNDEQALCATAAPLFGLHLMREQIMQQQHLLSGAATPAARAAERSLVDHAARAVAEAKTRTEEKAAAVRDECAREKRAQAEKHAAERARLQAALAAAHAQLERHQRESEVALHKAIEEVEERHISEVRACLPYMEEASALWRRAPHHHHRSRLPASCGDQIAQR